MTEILEPTRRSQPLVAWLALFLAVMAMLASFGFAWYYHDRQQQLELQLARRIGEFDAASREARTAAKAANEALADLQTRLLTMETRANDTQSQQLALTTMYQELARSQDERIVADIEQTLLLAQQQLQLAGNVRAALLGLEAADVRLAQLGKPQFASLRATMARDIERLKLLPAADIEGASARLEVLIESVSRLKPESETEPRAQPERSPASVASGQASMDTLKHFSQEAWREIKELIRIRRLDQPELPLLTPSQNYFLRQNLKLRLLAARVALVQRDETSFRADISAARDWVKHYFNRQDEVSKSFIGSLDELLRTPVALKDAQISASLQAIRSARGAN
jgi:uroporphyrin-III C-methyltransferase